MLSANSRSNFVKDGNTTYEYDANGNVWQIVVECMRMLWYDL